MHGWKKHGLEGRRRTAFIAFVEIIGFVEET
jgi:hypothetical protein